MTSITMSISDSPARPRLSPNLPCRPRARSRRSPPARRSRPTPLACQARPIRRGGGQDFRERTAADAGRPGISHELRCQRRGVPLRHETHERPLRSWVRRRPRLEAALVGLRLDAAGAPARGRRDKREAQAGCRRECAPAPARSRRSGTTLRTARRRARSPRTARAVGQPDERASSPSIPQARSQSSWSPSISVNRTCDGDRFLGQAADDARRGPGAHALEGADPELRLARLGPRAQVVPGGRRPCQDLARIARDDLAGGSRAGPVRCPAPRAARRRCPRAPGPAGCHTPTACSKMVVRRPVERALLGDREQRAQVSGAPVPATAPDHTAGSLLPLAGGLPRGPVQVRSTGTATMYAC